MAKIDNRTPQNKSAVAGLVQNAQFSQREIAKSMNISQSSVNRVKNKFEMGKDLVCIPMEKCKKK